MSYDDFKALVRLMRSVQKDYFRTRSKDSLNESKRLERMVDVALDDNGQVDLFDFAKECK